MRGGSRLTVIAIVADRPTRDLLFKVVTRDVLHATDDLAEGLVLAESHPPDVAFVEIGMGEGAGLALVHHVKAVVPSVTVFALASRTMLEVAANAVALGGAGLIMLPAGGDELLSALTAVRTRVAERAMRADMEQAAVAYSHAAGWMARVAELSDSSSRAAAAQHLVDVLVEVTAARGAAVYLTVGDRPTELVRAAVSASLSEAPAAGMEGEVLDYARRERLLAVPLAMRTLKTGHVLLAPSSDASPSSGSRLDGLVKLLATQATSAFALLGERERAGGTAIKDPASSAYSFAYYVDVAGREIDKARRYGRRFAIATVSFDTSDGAPPPMRPAEMADQLLKAARDTDILAHVDEHEFHLLMPETDGLGAHACRRRVLTRLGERGGGRLIPRGLQVGVSSFPHDGQNLSQLLRVARRRAEATRYSLVRRLSPDQTGLLDLLEVLEWELETPPANAVSAARALELAIPDAAALATAVVADALRGGATILTVAHHERLSLGAAVRASMGTVRDNVTIHAVDVRATAPGVEALAVIAEHGAYALIGKSEDGVVRGLHAADPLLADLLAERLGRAAGLRLFT